MREIEYRRYQTGATPFLPPLRFAGQYWDAETDFNENWNRYYYPFINRYLSPEPLLQDPNFVRSEAMVGRSTPTYAYALNNPIKYSDPTGLFVGDGLMQCWSDCVLRTIGTNELIDTQVWLYPAATVAGSEACQTVVGTAAFDWFGKTGLETAGSAFRVVRGSGAAVAAGAIAVQAACFAFCRLDFTPGPYRGPGDTNFPSNPNQLGARRPGWPGWRY
jgi:RHS repeat-associated protein